MRLTFPISNISRSLSVAFEVRSKAQIHAEVGYRVLWPHGTCYTTGQGSLPLRASVVTEATTPQEESEGVRSE
jgi:hypothetical protein